MVAHRKTGRLGARAVAAAVAAGIMLALAGTALARRADTPLRPVDNTPAPIVRETVLRPGTGPDGCASASIA